MSKKFKFTQEDLDNMILEALNQGKDKGAKPNVFQELLAKTGLNRTRNERQGI